MLVSEALSSAWPSIRVCYVRVGNWNPEWIQVVIAFVAFWAALCAGHTSWRAYKTSYRPILRVVPLCINGALLLDRVALKSFGRGPAIEIVIVERRGHCIGDKMGEVDALEPLGPTHGPHFTEGDRIGRVVVDLNKRLADRSRYRVFYLDIAGGWHETEFEVVGCKFMTHRSVPRVREEIPKWVQERSQIVADL